MRIETRPLIGLLPDVEPQVSRLVLSASERALLVRAARLMDNIRDAVTAARGEDVAYSDPWIDLSLGASGIRDVLDGAEL